MNKSRIIVLWKDGKLHIREKSAPIIIFQELGYRYIATIGKLYSPHNQLLVQHYFDTHPERLLSYYLKGD